MLPFCRADMESAPTTPIQPHCSYHNTNPTVFQPSGLQFTLFYGFSTTPVNRMVFPGPVMANMKGLSTTNFSVF